VASIAGATGVRTRAAVTPHVSGIAHMLPSYSEGHSEHRRTMSA
jgi:hypothetical protein